MARFVILVDFQLKPGALAAFLPLVQENAAASVRDEPGCRRFDVLTPESPSPGQTDQVTLYEIYDDPAAFDAHLQTPHYARFRDATDDLIDGRIVRRFWVQENAET